MVKGINVELFLVKGMNAYVLVIMVVKLFCLILGYVLPMHILLSTVGIDWVFMDYKNYNLLPYLELVDS
ncbi:hypothetical protein LguiA_030508 [Lonicera macranthoides]